MKNILLLTIIILGSSLPKGFAQSDFRKGFIVTPEKDTVHGEIDYSVQQLCIFRKENSITEFAPSQLLGYRFYDAKYFSSQVLENSFVEALIIGELNLYKNDKGYFIQKSGGEVHKLESQKKAVEEGGIIKFRDDTRWKGIISFLTRDCEQSAQLIQKLGLNEISLTNFVINYHECREAAFTFFKASKPLLKLDVGLTAGLAQSFISLNREMNYFGYLKDHYSSVDPFFGFVFTTSFPRLGEKVTLQTEFLLIKAGFSSYIVKDLPFSNEYHTADIEVTSLSIPFLLKYSLSENKIPLFFQLGIGYDNHFRYGSVLISEREYQDNTSTTTESKALALRKNQIGFIGGVGVQKSFKRVKGVLAVRYLQGHQPYSFRVNPQQPRLYPDLLAKIDRLSLSLILQTK